MIIFLLICSTILSKSYSTVLLDLYFNIKTKPLINTIDELIANKEIKILSNFAVLSVLSSTHSQYIETIVSRVLEYNDLLLKTIYRSKKFDFQHILIKDLIEKRALILCNSDFSLRYEYFSNGLNLVDGEEKIGFTFSAYFMSKKP